MIAAVLYLVVWDSSLQCCEILLAQLHTQSTDVLCQVLLMLHKQPYA